MAVHKRGNAFAVYVYDPHVGRKRYVGVRRSETAAQELFEKTTADYKDRVKGPGNIAAGCAAEHRAIAELLERGHQVAKPVVDNDGVDLVVDYRIKVQIKSSTYLRPPPPPGERVPRRALVGCEGYVLFNLGRPRNSHTGDQKNRHADVFLLYDGRFSERQFYVVPATEISGAAKNLQLSPKYQMFREAWHVFAEWGST